MIKFITHQKMVDEVINQGVDSIIAIEGGMFAATGQYWDLTPVFLNSQWLFLSWRNKAILNKFDLFGVVFRHCYA